MTVLGWRKHSKTRPGYESYADLRRKKALTILRFPLLPFLSTRRPMEEEEEEEEEEWESALLGCVRVFPTNI